MSNTELSDSSTLFSNYSEDEECGICGGDLDVWCPMLDCETEKLQRQLHDDQGYYLYSEADEIIQANEERKAAALADLAESGSTTSEDILELYKRKNTRLYFTLILAMPRIPIVKGPVPVKEEKQR